MTTEPRSEAERIAQIDPEERVKWLAKVKPEDQWQLEYDWNLWARDDQRPPEGDWRTWFVMAGRGFGKTRMAAEWVRAQAEADGSLRIALVAATMHEARSVMIEGESGLLAIAPDEKRPIWEPSLKRLIWPTGAIATVFAASEPEGLRGPEHHLAWADEVAKWHDGVAAWDNLAMTMRLGETPRIVATTTPRSVLLVRRLLVEGGVEITRGAMEANRSNLPTSFRAAMHEVYGHARLGRQELLGEFLEDAEDALWTRDLIERCRIKGAPEMRRIVIGVDPPASTGGDACGIVVVGKGSDGKAYVLADHSVKGRSPEGWASAVSAAALTWGADRVVAEANNGGDMVVSTLQAADVTMPVKKVSASRGKVARAEPVAMLYEAGKAFHIGGFPELEDELCGLISGGGYEGPGRSPDRADALVWAMSELMLGKRGAEPRIRQL
ncbi:MAG: DNA-packaging protein [Sphingomonadales bacterium]|jgi:phage terminase large subunit-like protein|uniref:DNA-packaging protein n=2 Tax=Sphingorhabdus sp. TaxID=1902408 RepID=UPI001B4700EB|nr:DNA-packaging protein [Sphingomonadales bacterium]MBK9432571.1 DNA-packaging protein [Sphingomonadales bacterium]MBL0021902.1 DNA-packaging protein [Sphingomonadales bacterium]MBP6379281.1 DNA-packaging protein [Sphingorhabdus sp.]